MVNKMFYSCWIPGRKASSILWDYYSKISVCNRWILQTKRTGQCYEHFINKVCNIVEQDPDNIVKFTAYSVYQVGL